ncbi:hypothetical protein CYLTODRAFT_415778 [Cylindrobasidium torrendii FP15055 ss-10]|uniref:Uncharacterized protein n=1 Tax=Cylindrobasidium torrendii FP15055 ss-10 TaxID=1314674 RepID=A0A0D7AUJ6_9AGAR|nr:hypothetical protein CYLTODRAFT_415778 [Cylindrobasidium torrendii FP15055 ss-10]
MSRNDTPRHVDEEEPPRQACETEHVNRKSMSARRQQLVQLPPPQRRTTAVKEPKLKALATTPGPQAALLEYSRVDVIDKVILKTINAEMTHAASIMSGPVFQWGRAGRLNVCTDTEWDHVKTQIISDSRIHTVTVILNVTEAVLAPYRRADAPFDFGQPLSQSSSGVVPTAGGQVPLGTSIPTLKSYEPYTVKKSAVMADICSEHKAACHGTCALVNTSAGVTHCIFTRHCVADFADYLLAHRHQLGAYDSRADESLYSDVNLKSAFLKEEFGMFAGFLAASRQESLPAHTSHTRSPLPDHNICSSSLPAFKDEIDICVYQFVAGQLPHLRMQPNNVDTFKTCLKDHDYNLQTIGNLSNTEIGELSGLKKGHVAGFKRSSSGFAAEISLTIQGNKFAPLKQDLCQQRCFLMHKKHFSFGLKSGKYGGKKMSLASSLFQMVNGAVVKYHNAPHLGKRL